ncbi:hypothetical protein KPSA1_00167 [Pseudomonas syringae pv. actinidiae]|uniref:Uncharacterized protein n=1 Tax=Pseudomonas syringae pv. actinidiae TaxID=103796 RepID=A0A2V0Q3U6_PSESF|nr:hypothetical protein KPSA1_00167 [Pseudomonas syringae pv. actinidiae]
MSHPTARAQAKQHPVRSGFWPKAVRTCPRRGLYIRRIFIACSAAFADKSAPTFIPMNRE